MLTMYGQYQVVERIAVGGMAEIYRGIARGVEGFERPVVIKKVHPRFSKDSRFVKMLIKEAKITARLNHPNIVQILDLGQSDDGEYFIVMEYVDGHDLRAVMDRASNLGVSLGLDTILYLASEVCDALDHAHRLTDSKGRPLNLIHRDVSPSNILISYAGEVKLTDFGVARFGRDVSVVGSLKGKLAYMSPEQARAHRIDHRSDIYSLGAVLFELLLGRRVFLANTDLEMLNAVRRADIPRPAAIDPSIPQQLEDILLQALSPEPSDRYQAVDALGTALRSFRFSQCSARVGSAELAALLGRLFDDGNAEREDSAVKSFTINTIDGIHDDKLPRAIGSALSEEEERLSGRWSDQSTNPGAPPDALLHKSRREHRDHATTPHKASARRNADVLERVSTDPGSSSFTGNQALLELVTGMPPLPIEDWAESTDEALESWSDDSQSRTNEEDLLSHGLSEDVETPAMPQSGPVHGFNTSSNAVHTRDIIASEEVELAQRAADNTTKRRALNPLEMPGAVPTREAPMDTAEQSVGRPRIKESSTDPQMPNERLGVRAQFDGLGPILGRRVKSSEPPIPTSEPDLDDDEEEATAIHLTPDVEEEEGATTVHATRDTPSDLLRKLDVDVDLSDVDLAPEEDKPTRQQPAAKRRKPSKELPTVREGRRRVSSELPTVADGRDQLPTAMDEKPAGRLDDAATNAAVLDALPTRALQAGLTEVPQQAAAGQPNGPKPTPIAASTNELSTSDLLSLADASLPGPPDLGSAPASAERARVPGDSVAQASPAKAPSGPTRADNASWDPAPWEIGGKVGNTEPRAAVELAAADEGLDDDSNIETVTVPVRKSAPNVLAPAAGSFSGAAVAAPAAAPASAAQPSSPNVEAATASSSGEVSSPKNGNGAASWDPTNAWMEQAVDEQRHAVGSIDTSAPNLPAEAVPTPMGQSGANLKPVNTVAVHAPKKRRSGLPALLIVAPLGLAIGVGGAYLLVSSGKKTASNGQVASSGSGSGSGSAAAIKRKLGAGSGSGGAVNTTVASAGAGSGSADAAGSGSGSGSGALAGSGSGSALAGSGSGSARGSGSGSTATASAAAGSGSGSGSATKVAALTKPPDLVPAAKGKPVRTKPVRTKAARKPRRPVSATPKPVRVIRKPRKPRKPRRPARRTPRRVVRPTGKGKGKGKVAIKSDPWAYIVIDGRRTKMTTSARAFSLSAGTHRITLVNPNLNLKKTITIVVEAGGLVRRFVPLR